MRGQNSVRYDYQGQQDGFPRPFNGSTQTVIQCRALFPRTGVLCRPFEPAPPAGVSRSAALNEKVLSRRCFALRRACVRIAVEIATRASLQTRYLSAANWLGTVTARATKHLRPRPHPQTNPTLEHKLATDADCSKLYSDLPLCPRSEFFDETKSAFTCELKSWLRLSSAVHERHKQQHDHTSRYQSNDCHIYVRCRAREPVTSDQFDRTIRGAACWYFFRSDFGPHRSVGRARDAFLIY